MARTIQIPSSRHESPQTDKVRTGCCLSIKFPKSGYFACFGFKVHVKKHTYGPFKTPIWPTSVSWHFDSDDLTVSLDGTIDIDDSFPCDETNTDDLCKDDDRTEATREA